MFFNNFYKFSTYKLSPLSLIAKQGLGKTQPLERNQ